MQKHPRISLNKTKIAFKGSPCFYAFQPSSVRSWEYHYDAGVFCLNRCKTTSRKNSQPVSTSETLYLSIATPENFPQSVFHSHYSQSILPILVQVCFFQYWQLGWIKKYGLFKKNYKESNILLENNFININLL